MASLPNIFSILSASWGFLRTHSVLNHVALWFIILPTAFLHFFMRLFEHVSLKNTPSPYQGTISLTPSSAIVLIILFFLLTVLLLWGAVCIIFTARRIIKKTSGRNRTSFGALVHKTRPLLIPLVFTSILRTCFILFRALLVLIPLALLLTLPKESADSSVLSVPLLTIVMFIALIPSLIYSIQTTFYDIVVVTEKKVNRAALHRSQSIVKPHTAALLLYLLGLSIILFIPVNIVASLVEYAIVSFDPLLLPIADIIRAGLSGISTVLLVLSEVMLFVSLTQNTTTFEHILPPT
jgi:hypothetical protein